MTGGDPAVNAGHDPATRPPVEGVTRCDRPGPWAVISRRRSRLTEASGGTSGTLTITSVNDAPTPADDVVDAVADIAKTFDVRVNDTDPEGQALQVDQISAEPSHGTIVINPDGTLTYTPAAGFTGKDTFQYRVCDVLALCSYAEVTVNVGENLAPTAVDVAVGTNQGQPVQVTVLDGASDPEGQQLTVTNPTTPGKG